VCWNEFLLKITQHKWPNGYMFDRSILCFSWKMAKGPPVFCTLYRLIPIAHMIDIRSYTIHFALFTLLVFVITVDTYCTLTIMKLNTCSCDCCFFGGVHFGSCYFKLFMHFKSGILQNPPVRMGIVLTNESIVHIPAISIKLKWYQ